MESACALAAFVSRCGGFVYPGWWQPRSFSKIEAGGAMAENEQAEGADGAEAGPSKKGKLKLIIAVAGFVVILGAGAGWFFLMRGHGEEKHAEAPPPRDLRNRAMPPIGRLSHPGPSGRCRP
jgi:hypothetical protein